MDDDIRPPSKRPQAIALGVALAAFVAWMAWPQGKPDVRECGRIGDEATLDHDVYCHLAGTVETAHVVSMGKVDRNLPMGPERYQNVRWFAKLHGADVVVALQARQPEVFKWHQTHDESLLGYQVDGIGRLFDVDRERGYDGMGKALRKTIGLQPDSQLFVFDTGDVP